VKGVASRGEARSPPLRENPQNVIDLRSDTVTRPCDGMRQAMSEAVVGDDVFGEDPTVNALEALAAERTGKPAALFVSSGTQSNLLALMSHCDRGDEYIAGQDAHTYRFEGGGAAVLGGIQPQPLPFNERGELDLDDVARAIKPDDFHFAKTRLICLENTQGGKVLSLDYMQQAAELARSRGLNIHLDGARVFNAAVELSVDVREIAQHFDTVSICLSKGLGAPVGSVLVGEADVIQRARRMRKMLGGGMRQAGMLAAAGIFALENNVDRLAEDHANASALAEGLRSLPGFELREAPQTNMVMLSVTGDRMGSLIPWLAERGVRISGGRWVCHKDVSEPDVERVIALCGEFAG